MDEYTADAFANRDEPVALLTVPSDIDASASEGESPGRRQRLRKSLSPSRLKEKAQGLAENAETPGRTSLQDRLFARVLQQVIPTEDVGDDEDVPKMDRRSSNYVKRPAFSLPVMTNNFRRFNARIGIVFVFQNRMIRLFTWRSPTQTLSFLATYTFVCLDPYLLSVLPLAVTLLFIMVPAFVSRHPPPPPQAHASSTTPYYTYAGPAIAPARTIKPASETSKDFFRNMRDLQNSMADFSNVHDALVSFIAPATNFSDEILSSTIFLYLTILSLVLFIMSSLLPFRLIFLVLGYGLIISSHPTIQAWLLKQQRKAFSTKNTKTTSKSNTTIFGIPLPPIPPALYPLITSLSTITLSSQPETREVEIFELQHRPLSSSSDAASEWQPFLFTPTPYDPLSPSRIAGDRAKGTRFFEDVQPPNGWEWANKKWELDMDAGEWVNERLVVGVEYDVMNRDDDNDSDEPEESDDRRGSVNGEFGGWVWDLPPQPGQAEMTRDDEMWLAYGDYDFPSKEDEKKKKKGHKKGVESKDWEEAVRYGNRGKTGEWRRRRWVRAVKRKEIREHTV